jgi:hypothetical protein
VSSAEAALASSVTGIFANDFAGSAARKTISQLGRKKSTSIDDSGSSLSPSRRKRTPI